ncbi:uncharacterized protein LOC106673514, partial [Cimex lectularius]|uniref:Ionotropic glutamate receptor L-glutamate and glycine-binding domain-containing protein n=1 Tax=Cimex lectularius TaxID=79782 RepID=A0A8I6SGE2_CIMLE
DVNTFNISAVWLLFAESIDILKNLKSLPLGISSDVVLRLANGSLYDVYKTAPQYSLQAYDCGVLSRSDFRLEQKRKNDLEGITLTAAFYTDVKIDNDYQTTRQYNDPTYYPRAELYNREHFMYHQQLQKLLNFKTFILRSASYGNQISNGSWNGMVGEVSQGKAEVSIAPLQLRNDRGKVVKFLVSLSTLRIVFMFRQKKYLGSYNALMLPFSTEAWIYTFITMGLFVVFYETISYIRKSLSKGNSSETGVGFIFVVGIMALQGNFSRLMKTPNTCSMRILSIALLLFGLFVSTFYNAAIMHGLLTPVPIPVPTLEQLVKNPSLELGILDANYLSGNRNSWAFFFKPETRAQLEKRSRVMSADAGLEMMRTKRFAFCTDDFGAYWDISRKFSDSEKCEIVEIETRDPFHIGWMVGRNSTNKELFNRGIIWLKENGLSYRTKRFWFPMSPSCYGSITFLHVTLEAVVIAVGIYLAGVVFSIFDVTTFNVSFAWLLYAESLAILKKLKSLPLGISSDVILRLSNSSLYDIYKTAPQYHLQAYHCGVLSRLDFRLEKNKRTDLDGITLTAALVTELKLDNDDQNMSQKLTDQTYFPEAEIYNREHFMYQLYLEKWLVFKMNITRSSTLGSEVAKGNWTGLVKYISQGKADVATVPMQPMDDFRDLVQYLVPMMKLRFIFMFRQPKFLSTYNALIRPFSPEVWTYILITMGVFVLFCEIISFTRKYFKKENAAEIGDGFVYVIGVMTYQGLITNPYTTSMKMTSIALLLFALFASTYYNAATLHGLLTPAPNSIQTVEQLLKSQLMELGIIKDNYLTNYSKSWGFILKPETRAKLEKEKITQTVEKGVEKVRTERFAFCTDDHAVYWEVSRKFSDSEKCEITEIETINPFPVCLTVEKNSSYKELFNQGLIWIKENGLSNRLKKFWYPMTPSCYGNIRFVHVTLEVVFVAVGAFLAGVVISIFLLGIELLIHLLH